MHETAGSQEHIGAKPQICKFPPLSHLRLIFSHLIHFPGFLGVPEDPPADPVPPQRSIQDAWSATSTTESPGLIRVACGRNRGFEGRGIRSCVLQIVSLGGAGQSGEAGGEDKGWKA